MSPAGGHIAAIARAVAVTHAHSRARSTAGPGGTGRGSTSATFRRQSAPRSDSFNGGPCSSGERPPSYPPPGPSGQCHHYAHSTDHNCARTAWRDDGSASIATASSSRYTYGGGGGGGRCPSARPPLGSLQPSVSMQFSEARGYYTKFRQQNSDLQEGSEGHERSLSAHRKWLHRNRVGNLSGSYHLARGAKYRASPGAAILLYLGLGLVVVGVVITFVGVGDHAFQTLELQLIGPVLILLGFLLCGIRVLICAFAGRCTHCDKPIVATGEDSDFEMTANHLNSSSHNHDLVTKTPARKPSVAAVNHNHTNHTVKQQETQMNDNCIPSSPKISSRLQSSNNQHMQAAEQNSPNPSADLSTVIETSEGQSKDTDPTDLLPVLDESAGHESQSDSELDQTTEFLLCKATQTSREPSLRRPRGGGYRRDSAIYVDDIDKESLEGFLEVVLRRVDGSPKVSRPLITKSPPLTPPTPPIKSVTRYCTSKTPITSMTTSSLVLDQRPELLLNPGSLQPTQ